MVLNSFTHSLHPYRPRPFPSLYVTPLGKFRAAWDVLTAFLLAYILLLTPYRLSFNIESEGFAAVLDRIVDIFFIVGTNVPLWWDDAVWVCVVLSGFSKLVTFTLSCVRNAKYT